MKTECWPEQLQGMVPMPWIETNDLHLIDWPLPHTQIEIHSQFSWDKTEYSLASLTKDLLRTAIENNYLKKSVLNNLNVLIQMRVSLYIGL